jgi:catechol 2,3-dioxygenase
VVGCARNAAIGKRATGLYQFAILFPTRASLARAFRRVLAAGVELEGAADHGVSETLYLRDPDGNGVELCRDRPRAEWPRTATGELQMFTQALDLESLLREPDDDPQPVRERSA